MSLSHQGQSMTYLECIDYITYKNHNLFFFFLIDFGFAGDIMNEVHKTDCRCHINLQEGQGGGLGEALASQLHLNLWEG